MSDEELARQFNLKIEGVKELKKRLKRNDYKQIIDKSVITEVLKRIRT